MLISELIVRHVGPQNAVHERGIRLNQTQVPRGVRTHDDGDVAVAPVAGDLLLVSAPVGSGLREHVDTDLPVGTTVALLLEVEVTELPVGRVLAALAVAKLQVVDVAVVTGTAAAMVAVVATRTDDLVVPQPYLAHQLEPGNHDSPAALRRVLGEHALEGLVQRARERVLREALGQAEARLQEVTTELGQLRADRWDHQVALVRDLDTASQQMRSLRSSKSFRVATRLARVSRSARRIIRRSGGGKAGG